MVNKNGGEVKKIEMKGKKAFLSLAPLREERWGRKEGEGENGRPFGLVFSLEETTMVFTGRKRAFDLQLNSSVLTSVATVPTR